MIGTKEVGAGGVSSAPAGRFFGEALMARVCSTRPPSPSCRTGTTADIYCPRPMTRRSILTRSVSEEMVYALADASG